MGNKRDNGENKTREAQGMSDNYDNSRQLFSTLKTMKTASRTGTRLVSGFLRQLGQLFQGAPPNRAMGRMDYLSITMKVENGRGEK